MVRRKWHRLRICVAAALLLAPVPRLAATDVPSVSPSRMLPIGNVDARFQSYNIEMVEITGGPFWRPYRRFGTSTRSQSARPEGSGANLFQDRPPIDLTNARLRVLAAALGPA